MNHHFDIIGLTETWLNESNQDILGFPNYNHVYMYRQNKTGGGVSILLQTHIQYKELTEFSICNELFECVFVEVEMTGNNVIIGCIYRPPNSNLSQFNNDFAAIIKKFLVEINMYISYGIIMLIYSNLTLINKRPTSLIQCSVCLLFHSLIVPRG